MAKVTCLSRCVMIFVAVLAAALVAQGAAAKEGEKVTISPPLSKVAAGSVWHITLTYREGNGKPWIVSGYPPIVNLRNAETGALLYAQTHGGAKSGVWTGDLRLPKSGKWAFAIDDGYSFSEDNWSKPVTFGGTNRPFPIIPVAGGALAAILFVALLLLWKPRRLGRASGSARLARAS